LPTPRKKLDNESGAAAAFIEETQDTDVAEIIGMNPSRTNRHERSVGSSIDFPESFLSTCKMAPNTRQIANR
jgi:hypothetical protein